MPGERGFRRASDGDDFDGEALEGGQEVEQFLGFARIAERDDEIAVIDNAEVAVEGVHAVENDAGGPGAGERGGDFAADVAGFADADDDELAPAAERIHDEFDSLDEGAVKQAAHGLERGKFDVKDFAGTGQMTHGSSVPSTDGAGNVEGTGGGLPGPRIFFIFSGNKFRDLLLRRVYECG